MKRGLRSTRESIRDDAARRNNPRKWFHGVGSDATQIGGIGDGVTLECVGIKD